MATAHLPRNCTLAAIADALGEAGVLAASGRRWLVHVVDDGFIDVGAMAFLCAWVRGRAHGGARIHFRGDDGVICYLARMDLHEHVGIEQFTRARSSSRNFSVVQEDA